MADVAVRGSSSMSDGTAARPDGQRCTTHLAVDGNIAVITLDHPPVNALHPALLASLTDNLQEAQKRDGVRAIVITGASGRFSAGFDIHLFRGAGVGPLLEQRTGLMHAFNTLLEAGAKPTVAAIDRMALGGGLELALACNARLASPGTVLGLPETQLGILPGFGGTQRLSHVVGMQLALDMLISGKSLKVHEAEEVGLIDEIIPAADLLTAAKRVALEIADGRRPRPQALKQHGKLGSQEEVAVTLAEARQRAAKQHSGQRHFQLCLDAVQAGVEQGPEQGLEVEGAAFAEAVSLSLHRALVRALFAQKAANKVWVDGGLSWPLLQLWALVMMMVVMFMRLWAAVAAALHPASSPKKKVE